MNLKRQLLLVSTFTLVLPWAGCEFIRETESALRAEQQNMLASVARAHARSISPYIEEFPAVDAGSLIDDQLYLHELSVPPAVDGYFDDWSLPADALRVLRGPDGPVRLAIAAFGNDVYVFVEVTDRNVIYAASPTSAIYARSQRADRVTLVSSNPPYLEEQYIFSAEAPGRIISYRPNESGFESEPAINAYWQDIPGGAENPGGYRIEARIPMSLLGTHLGLVVDQTDSNRSDGVRVSTFSGSSPGATARLSPELANMATPLLSPDMRILVTDALGWRLAAIGQLTLDAEAESVGSATLHRIYDWLVEPGISADFADPDARGRERQPYVSAALAGEESSSWFRSREGGRAIVAVAAPIVNDNEVIGALILQQGTEAILSLRNEGLARLVYVSLIATVLAAGALLGYATWLSRRVRKLSIAAENALEEEQLQTALPSALADDEIGDLSRGFSQILRQLDDYNAYLRSLASKLSHELRTPLTIVTSSLENLEHESLSEEGIGYTRRAQEGANRLRRILGAMSEASRVEELMRNVDLESFDLRTALDSTTSAYQGAYPARRFTLDCDLESLQVHGAPELFIQMLDKLVDNAVGFSKDGDEICLTLDRGIDGIRLSVYNPGPPLPQRMQAQMFDSMVSVRQRKDSQHLGLGLYIAKLIADAHGASIEANNRDDGVVFTIVLPAQDSR